MHLARIAELLAPFRNAPLSDAQLSQLAAYLEILHRWNARMNLTSVRGPEQVVTRHFGESLFAAQALFPSGAGCPQPVPDQRLLDIGSGAGFPGLPIKICSPDVSVTLIESQHRKATFLREVIRALDLKDITVSATRAEEFDITNKQVGMAHIGPGYMGRGNVGSNDVGSGNVGPGAPAGAAPYLTQNTVAAGASPAAPRITVTLRAVERFDRVLPTAARLATPGRLALLIGESQVAAAHRVAPGIDWQEPLLIPLSDARVLLIGESH